MKQRRFTTAAWMLVPIVLAAPALTAGLSLWFEWGPQWTALAIFLAAALLALSLDHRCALRYGRFGAAAGLLTCPLLMLLNNPAWYLFVIWVLAAAALPALSAALLFDPPQQAHAQPATHAMVQADAETLEQLAARQRSGHD